MKLPKFLAAILPSILTQSPRTSLSNLDRFFSEIRMTTSGEQISPESAKRISAYWACGRNIAEDVAKLPLHIFRRTDQGKEKATGDPRFQMLHTQPNPSMTAMTFRDIVTQRAVFWGNGISEIQRNGFRDAIALWPIEPSRVMSIKTDDATGKAIYKIRNPKTNVDVDIPGDDILDIRGPGDGLMGFSVAETARQSLGIAAAAQTFSASFFGNGTMLQGILEHPGQLSVEQVNRIRESWNKKHQGPYKAFKTAILEDGMKFVATSMPMRDAQFLESRMFQVEEIARWFRMPPHKIQHLQRSTFSNIEQQSIEYVTDTLMPWLVRWEQEIKRKLFPEEEDVFAEHNVSGLLRGDSAARAKFYKDNFMVGAFSPNQILALENMNGIGPEGDKHYVPLNMIAIGEPPPKPNRGRSMQNRNNEPPIDDGHSEEINTLNPFERVIRDAANRMVNKEVNAARRHASKSDYEFNRCMSEFYQKHNHHIVKSLEPATCSLFEFSGIEGGPVPFLTELADKYCKEGMETLTKARSKNIVEQLCESWSSNRVEMMTRAVMQTVKPE